METAPLKKRGLKLKIIVVAVIASIIPTFLYLFISNPIFLMGISIFSAVLLSIILVSFLNPLQKLIQNSENISQGNFSQRIDIRSGDEFEELGNALSQMGEKISKIHSETEKQKDSAVSENSRLNQVLSSIVDGIIALDFNKNIILSNKSAQQLSGYTDKELQGQPIDKLMHFFVETEEILPKSYCQLNFNKSAKLVGKDGRGTKVNITTSQIGEAVQTNLSYILILHDLSKEEELERMKFDFVSMASHELKTPLTSIVGYLSVFVNENKDKLPKEEWELVNRSLIAAQQLFTLVQNLLNVNKIEREQITITPQSLDFLPILSKCVEDLKNQATLKNISLILNKPNNLPQVLADPIRVSEVVTNLVANAINYTNPGGKVNISVAISPSEVTTSVSDTGVGIPKEAMPHLFTKFFRVSNTMQQASKGTGLGLYIAKSIIEKHNGKIWVESVEGKGSIFYFTLPVAKLQSSLIDSGKFVGAEIQAGALNY
ncbi:hypothetical protein A3C59_01035 [Candidatus Daviesbacteria bacterium RIFCSPHIGHO2_02_FULL_36_13]|uniref:histidine kinase n=1 Tax=Candidatus Daviesbacteria bacterium RIFCSPHIGHO2_02_FULL_36_13 TaxID=1797768 RepID=A0A1F5JYJ3_9BACT|nr:MAG: hypothetical protein A3C59_01035 [Candidatus Daviesbacteria bacterium RIFCSPHIGHO2_02_FULL_36_13]